MTWQKRARLLVGVFAVAFAVFVAFAFRRQPPKAAAPKVVLPPNVVTESTSGRVFRWKAAREDVEIEYDRQIAYKDGTMKLVGVRVTSRNRADGRTFVVTAREGQARENPSSYDVDGDVKLTASDGLVVRTEHATYADPEGIVRAPGPVEFAKNRMSGHGHGMTYDKTLDSLTILDQAVVHVDRDENSKDGATTDISAGTAIFARREKQVRFDRGVTVQRGGELFEADRATAYLTEDEKRIDAVELRGSSRVRASKRAPGGLEGLTGRDMNLKYAPDGQSLQHLLIVGDAMLQLAGAAGKPGRQLAADVIDTFVAADGQTPTALAGRDNVRLTFPAEGTTAARTIRAKSIDAVGEQGRGLTAAHFGGDVEFREQGAGVDRSARAPSLDVAMKPGMTAIDEAKFAGGTRFTDGKMAAVAGAARYLLEKGQLELSGAPPQPGPQTPHVANEHIGVDAATMSIALAGPTIWAEGNVKSLIAAPKKSGQRGADPKADAKGDTRIPSMLKQDQPVNVIADALLYDGEASTAAYYGSVRLFQGDTTIKADTIVINDKTGDLDASDNVVTQVILEQVKKGSGSAKTKERVESVGTADEFHYEEKGRKATYAGTTHVTGPEGDITASRIELFLRPSGNELERAEAYADTPETVTLRESSRKTTASRVTYYAEDERYVATGTPVTIVDECSYKTEGRSLTFKKAADTITVDGQKKFRTSTTGSGKCQGSQH